jgi:preprotein translocase subunit SecD
MLKHRVLSIVLILIAVGVGFYVYKTAEYPFRFGLDLNGGTELTYRADISKIKSGDVGGAMASLRDVIERRINVFGVSEPIVQVENPGIVSGTNEYRLLVGLPGINNIEQAVELIGKTPQLEFKLIKPEMQNLTSEELKATTTEVFMSTGLDGQYLSGAQLQFTNSGSGQISGEPIVGITFNAEGRDLFAKITKENIGKVLAMS